MPKAKAASLERWSNAITHYADVDPSTLTPHPQNFRQHPKMQTDALNSAISEVGWIAPVIVNSTTGHTVDGHARIELAIRRGEPTVPVAYVNLTTDQERLALLTFDPIGALATQDQDMIEALLRETSAIDAGLQEFLESLSDTAPDFGAVGEDEQGRLDQRTPIECPSCGHEFVP